MVRDLNIQTASHWWMSENKIDLRARQLIPFLFLTLDSIYQNLLTFPEVWSSSETYTGIIGGKNNVIIDMPSSPNLLALFRSTIALLGDASQICTSLNKMDIGALDLSELSRVLQPYREVRNFFAHLDERLSSMDNHGISGYLKTSFGLVYENAVNCFHMIQVANTFYYTERHQAKEVSISKSDILTVLQASRSIYETLISHKVHGETSSYPPPSVLYPDL